MKKRITLFLLCMLLTACQQQADISHSNITDVPLSKDGKILIAYFSVMETDDVDTVSGASRVANDGALYGNTEFVAKIIQSKTNGDLYRIKTEQEYPATHQSLLEFAHKEREEIHDRN